MTTIRNSRNGLLWSIGALVLASLVFAMTDDSPAKEKKAITGKTDKEVAKKKEAKLEPPPSTFPKRKDIPETKHGTAEHAALIDTHITNGWKENGTYPSERCTDHEFIRRASLDVVGRIPTIEEIKIYMGKPEESRRTWLIDAMLEGKEYGRGEEYARNFANIWTVNLMTRTGSEKHYQDQMFDWLYTQFKGSEETKTKTDSTASPGESIKSKKETSKAKSEIVKTDPDWKKTATKLIAGAGITNEDHAEVNYLLHNLGEPITQDATKNGKWDMVPATSRTTRLFLGIRTQCVQCHDHPFNGEWRQEHFWGVNAFFRQVDTPKGRPGMMAKKKVKGMVGGQERELIDNKSFNGGGLIAYERRNTVLLFTDPSFLDGKKIPASFKGTRREALAGFITTSPWFSKAYVNRTWNHFFGKSFTRDAVDDFHENHPVSHPELLDKVSKSWAEQYHHNPKILIRWICNSQAYGLSSRANKWNDKTDDETLFARMLLKPMTPEQMFTSVTIATLPGWHNFTSEKKAQKLEGGKKWFDQLVSNFGNDEGEEGSYSGTVIQALLLMNGQETNKALIDKEGTVEHVIQKRGATYKALPTAIQDMYMHALGRPASQKEIFDMTNAGKNTRMWAFRGTGDVNPISLPSTFWSAYYQDIMWALLNSNEFILNH